jgi:hypothetical protein
MVDAMRRTLRQAQGGLWAPDCRLPVRFEAEDLLDVGGDVGAGDLRGAAGLGLLCNVDYSRILA